MEPCCGNQRSLLKDALFRRLEKSGIDSNLIPALWRGLATTQRVSPNMSTEQINRRLHFLGWQDVRLDHYTWQLALDCFSEDEREKRPWNFRQMKVEDKGRRDG